MNKCHVCGSTEFRDEYVSEMFQIDGKRVLVEGIPATVCKRCGDTVFSCDTAERIRKLLNGPAKAEKKVEMEVFAFS